VKAFIPTHRQERFLEIIAKPKKRKKLLSETGTLDGGQTNRRGSLSLVKQWPSPSSASRYLGKRHGAEGCEDLPESAPASTDLHRLILRQIEV
jgi:hypothetical protein